MKDEILKQNEFVFKKQFGQNFLTDKNLLKAICSDAEVTSDDEVLEIGPGAGALTYELARKAKKVVCYEIDKDLKPVLTEKLKEFNNVEVIFNDILKVDEEEIKSHFTKPFKVVANLPYYITTPIIFYFLENDFNLSSLTIMVQKEVAERIVAKENTKDYGTITVSANILCDTKITRIVNRQMFYPAPNVDSAILHFKVNKNKFEVKDYATLSKLIKASFAMRRKTLMNNLKQAFLYSTDELKGFLKNANIEEGVRGERLTLTQFVALSNELYKK